ncbi:YeiH family protein [Nocardioides terrisoli]|uniref:YeiH family protein n=1 Tax=Nocardioides terrisoli TaxID=3388267 RepID=UPI00287B67D0|nr:putative sulfate exporter family transporter [Nocardioides marmorisolisilvae]
MTIAIAPSTARVRGSNGRLLPGVGLSLLGAGVAIGVNLALPQVSTLLVAILLGAGLANLRPLPEAMAPGLGWSGRRLLRAGVVLLGLQLSLREIVGLGPGVLVLVVCVVAGGITGTLLIGRLLGIGWSQRLLIACGFSICGAAAVAAADGAIDSDEEEVATAVALVVAFGTAMIGIIPLLVALLGLAPHAGGVWAGASIHEVAQVVAAGGVIGGGALGVAVVIKLARVLMLAPVLAWIGWRQRVRLADASYDGKLPPLVPLFVVGFCALVAVHTWVPVPPWALSGGKTLETGLLAAAMFALGCGVRVQSLRRVGPRPIVLAVLATVLVSTIGLVGALLVG